MTKINFSQTTIIKLFMDRSEVSVLPAMSKMSNAPKRKECYKISFYMELNQYFYVVVCHAGYFYEGPGCTLCIGNTIKTTAGNAANCEADPACDGVMTVPTDDHTGCGMSS